ncbi:MAG: 2'-5' RNA ligase family protein [Methanobacterium sp.]|nr:2'-5' RNA ligase family protein [Methanobacterium sp.]
MIKLIDLLKENSESTYDLGCVMLDFNFPRLKTIQDNIEEEDIYTEEGDKTYGLEDEPHITLLYGLHEGVTIEQVKEALKDIEFSNVRLSNISCFETPKYDVLKFDVEGEALNKAHEALKTLPFTSDFPEYHPHLTVCYLKKGKGKIYTQGFKGLNFILKPTKAVYSTPEGEKTEFEIQQEEI